MAQANSTTPVSPEIELLTRLGWAVERDFTNDWILLCRDRIVVQLSTLEIMQTDNLSLLTALRIKLQAALLLVPEITASKTMTKETAASDNEHKPWSGERKLDLE